MRLTGIAKAQKACHRAKAQFRELRGVDDAVLRARAIASLDNKLWRSRRVWRIRCAGTSGKGPHEMYVEAALLWSLIDLRGFRCPFHAHDAQQDDEYSLRNEGQKPMTTNTTDSDAVRYAIADIRRIIAEENLNSFWNDELLDACIGLVQAHEAARENGRNRKLHGDGDFLATLDAARHRAAGDNDGEREIITRAITRANRSLANR